MPPRTASRLWLCCLGLEQMMDEIARFVVVSRLLVVSLSWREEDGV